MAGQDPGKPRNSRKEEEPDRADDISATEPHRAFFRPLWAMLIARIYRIDPLECPLCHEPMQIIAFISESAPVKRILAYLGEPTELPVLSPARRPPGWEEVFDIGPDLTFPEPEPDFEFDQTVNG